MSEIARPERDYLWRHQERLLLALLLQTIVLAFFTASLDGGIRMRACALSLLAYWSVVGAARICLGPRLTLSAGLLLVWGGLVAVILGMPLVFWFWGEDPLSVL